MIKSDLTPCPDGLLNLEREIVNFFSRANEHHERVPAKVGRPLKRTDAYYKETYEHFIWLCKWHLDRFGKAHESVPKLLTAYSTEILVANGLRASRVESVEVRGRLKTWVNAISRARTLKRINAWEDFSYSK
ncbi:MAG TPA: hypothetical protein PLL01_09150 [Rhodoferax sp.]|jgi:hypothetical protein|nr:hypothetical protein [Rhodoferax sp.]